MVLLLLEKSCLFVVPCMEGRRNGENKDELEQREAEIVGILFAFSLCFMYGEVETAG